MKLHAEVLEMRDVPAAYYWAPPVNSDLLLTTASNWRTTASASGPTALVVPGIADDLYFRGDLSNANCIIYPTAGATGDEGPPPTNQVGGYNGVHLIQNYSGTVDFRISAYVNHFEMRSGAIAQNDPAQTASGNGGQITVTQNFDWTAGFINNGPSAAFFNLYQGAVGHAAPTNGGSVSSGSTLTLLGGSGLGSYLDMLKGTYTWLKGNGIVVNAHCNLELKPEVGAGKITLDGKEITADKGNIEIKTNGNLVIQPSSRPEGNTDLAICEIKGNRPNIFNFGGKVEIKDYLRLKFSTEEGTGIPGGYSQATEVSELDIQAGCEIFCGDEEKVSVSGGTVNISSISTSQTPQPEVKFVAPNAVVAFILGKEAILNMSSTKYSKLHVEGNAVLSGTIKLAISRVTAMVSDTITVSNIIEFNDDSKLILRWGDSGLGPLVGVNSTWEPVNSTKDNGINRLPAVTFPAEPMVTLDVALIAVKKVIEVKRMQ